MGFAENEYNQLSSKIIDTCIGVHKDLGAGLMESIYEVCTVKALSDVGLDVKSQVSLPIIFRGEKLQKNFVIDIVVEGKMILELKSVEKILPVHEAQLVSYLKLSGIKLGLLINYNVPLLKQGIRRKINGDLNIPALSVLSSIK
jgi:GxxExxY protein